MAPTLIDLCKLKVREQIDFDGQGLEPLLYNNSEDWNDDRTYVTQFTQGLQGGYHNYSPSKQGRTVVYKEKWRLMNDELYNIAVDPSQENNVANDFPEIAMELCE